MHVETAVKRTLQQLPPRLLLAGDDRSGKPYSAVDRLDVTGTRVCVRSDEAWRPSRLHGSHRTLDVFFRIQCDDLVKGKAVAVRATAILRHAYQLARVRH